MNSILQSIGLSRDAVARTLGVTVPPPPPSSPRTPKIRRSKPGRWAGRAQPLVLSVASELPEFTVLDVVQRHPQESRMLIAQICRRLVREGRLHRLRDGKNGRRFENVPEVEQMSVYGRVAK